MVGCISRAAIPQHTCACLCLQGARQLASELALAVRSGATWHGACSCAPTWPPARACRCREILRNSPTALRILKAAMNAAEDGQAGIQELGGNATLLFYQSEEGNEVRAPRHAGMRLESRAARAPL